MAELQATNSRSVITIEARDRYFFVPGERAIVGTKGIFVRNGELMVGSPVVVQVSKKQESVSVLGVVRASYRDLGVAIEFTEKAGRAARHLVTLLAA
jgi:hypothetical protein